MRKAFSLIELLLVITVLPVVLLGLNGVLKAFMRDLPQGTAVMNQQTTVLDLIDTIGRDVRGAVAFPDSAGGRQSDDQTLLIALPTGTVVYERTDGRIRRVLLDRQGREDPNGLSHWRLPSTVIAWQRWKQAEAVQGVEVHSHVKQIVDGHPQKKLMQTRLYLVNALGRAREVE